MDRRQLPGGFGPLDPAVPESFCTRLFTCQVSKVRPLLSQVGAQLRKSAFPCMEDTSAAAAFVPISSFPVDQYTQSREAEWLQVGMRAPSLGPMRQEYPGCRPSPGLTEGVWGAVGWSWVGP